MTQTTKGVSMTKSTPKKNISIIKHILVKTGICFPLLALALLLINPVFAAGIPWKITELIPGGRIDAVAYAGNNVVIVGTRDPNPGWIFYSTDKGVTWTKGQRLPSTEKKTGVTCIACAKNGLCFAINESSELYRSSDYGKTWIRMGKVSYGEHRGGGALSYGLVVTKQGALLISDTNSDGGYIFRSTDDGATFTKIGPVSPKPLYRFETVRDGIMVNGWEGAIYKSANDGKDWQLWSKMDSGALYATEFMRPETIVQASESGYVYTADMDKKGAFKKLAKPGAAADDFVYIGYNTLIYSTYTGSRDVFISYDKGNTWIDDGPVPTHSEGDWLDHVISIELPDSVIAIGGSHKGFIMRASFARADLYKKTHTASPGAPASSQNSPAVPQSTTTASQSIPTASQNSPAVPQRDFEKGLIGSLYDAKELDEPEDVLIDGKFAYVPCRGSNNLAVVDISNPHSPQLASSFRDPELIDAMGVAKHGDYIYLVSFSNHQCLVLDAKDPKALKKIYAFNVGSDGATADRLRKVVYKDGYLYLTHSNEGKLYIADAHNPAHPVIISDITTGDGAFAVFVQGNYAYVGGCFPGSSVKVINIADKKNPQLISTLSDSAHYGCTCSFQTSGNNLVDIAYSSNSLTVFDLANPAKPAQIGFLQSDLLSGPNRLALIGKKAYVINSVNDCLAELNLSSPGSPSLSYITQSWKLKKVYGMAAHNGLLYMVGRDSRYFLVVDPAVY